MGTRRWPTWRGSWRTTRPFARRTLLWLPRSETAESSSSSPSAHCAVRHQTPRSSSSDRCARTQSLSFPSADQEEEPGCTSKRSELEFDRPSVNTGQDTTLSPILYLQVLTHSFIFMIMLCSHCDASIKSHDFISKWEWRRCHRHTHYTRNLTCVFCFFSRFYFN